MHSQDESRWPAEWSGFIGKNVGAPGSSGNLIPLCTEKTMDKLEGSGLFKLP